MRKVTSAYWSENMKVSLVVVLKRYEVNTW